MVQRLNENNNLHESYDDYEDVWDAYTVAQDYLGSEELCLALAKAMGTDALKSNLRYIFRVYEIPFEDDDDDEFDEGCHRKAKRSKKRVKEAFLNARDLDESSLEYALEKYVGKPVKEARDYLESLGFEMFVMAGPSKRNDTWEEYTTDKDDPGSLSVKLYFDLIPGKKDPRRKENGKLTDYFVDRYR